MSACCQSNAKQSKLHKNQKLQQAHLSIKYQQNVSYEGGVGRVDILQCGNITV